MDHLDDSTISSCLLNFSYIISHFGSLYQLIICQNFKMSCEGISLDTYIMQLSSTFFRLLWIILDRRGIRLSKNPITFVDIILGSIIQTYFIYYILSSRDEPLLNQILSKNSKKKFYERWYYLVFFICILSFFIHQGLFNNSTCYFTDFSGMYLSYSVFIDAACLLPQIPLIFRLEDTGTISRNYILFLFASRILKIMFWIVSWETGNGAYYVFFLIGDIVYLAFVAWFLFSYFKIKRTTLLPSEEISKNKMF